MSLQSNELIGVLENDEVKDFITKHLDDNPKVLALKYAGKLNFDLVPVLSLLKLYQKAKHKLPRFVQSRLALTDRSYQQASSEQIASHKASILSGQSVIDLCAGLGVDSLAFASRFNRVVSVDSDPDLHELSRYNLKCLEIDNIERRLGKAEDQDVDSFDWIYLDPDRRSDGIRKVRIQDLQPNIYELLPKYEQKGKKVVLKLSPLLELNTLLDDWPSYVREVHFVSQHNEMKEVLAFFGPGKEPCKVIAQNIGKAPYQIEANVTSISQNPKQDWTGDSYLYFPHSALSKSRLADFYASSAGMHKLPGFEIYQSAEPMRLVGFKTLKILKIHSRDHRKLKNWLKREGIEGLNIWTKGSKLAPAQLAEKLGIKEGGDNYLLEIGGTISQLLYCKQLF